MDCFACCHCCQTQTKTLPSQTSNDQKSRDRLLSQILFLPARFAILYRQRNLLTQRSTRREKEDRKAAIIFHNNRWRLRCAMNTTCTNSATRRLKNIPSVPQFQSCSKPQPNSYRTTTSTKCRAATRKETSWKKPPCSSQVFDSPAI